MEPGDMFTITVPTKNRPALLERALRSILAQDYPQLEIVVVDDGDGAGAEAASKFGESRIRPFLSGRSGQVGARNQAIAQARGRWIAWLDDDDWWQEPDHLSRFARLLGGSDALAFASGTAVLETAGGRPAGRLPFTARCDALSIRRDNTLLASGVAYPRAFHQRFGAFDADLPIYWDWDWYLRLVHAGIAPLYSGGTGVCFSCRAETASSRDNESLRRADLDRFARKHGLTGLVLKNHEEIARSQV